MQPPNRRNSQPERQLPFICSLMPQTAPVTNPSARAAAALTQINRDAHNGSLCSVWKPVVFCFTGENPEIHTAFSGITAEIGSTVWAPFLRSAGMCFSAWSSRQWCLGWWLGRRNFWVQLCCWSVRDWTYWSAEHSNGPHSLSRFLLCSMSLCCCLRDYDFISVRDNLIQDCTNWCMGTHQ